MLGCARIIATLACAALLFGCGGGGESTSAQSGGPAVLTPAAVKRCLREGAKELRYAPPLAPKGSPLHAYAIFAIGPGGGHVGIVLSRRPALTARLVKAYDHRHEFKAVATQEGRAVMLFDWTSTKPDRELALECAEG
jgi:hypothetical protein